MRLKSLLSIVLSLSVLLALIPAVTYAENENCSHEFTSDYEYTNIDDNFHNVKESCIHCGMVRYEKEGHSYDDIDYSLEDTYGKVDQDYHKKYSGWVCDCGAREGVKGKHDYLEEDEDIKVDKKHHSTLFKCLDCNAEKRELKKHSYDYDSGCKKINKKYHWHYYECYCSDKKRVKEKHKFTGKREKTLRRATLKKKAKIKRYCDKAGCKAYKIVYKKWNYKDAGSVKPVYSKSYWCKHSTVSKYSRKVKIKMDNSIKGAIVKLKIGKKVYTKKLKSSKIKSFRIKIKKPKFNQKVSVKIYYKKKKIGEDYNSTTIVTPGSKLRVGMTKAEARYLWGSPDDIRYTSNSETWWYDDDDDGYAMDSYIYFYKGKVSNWYY